MGVRSERARRSAAHPARAGVSELRAVSARDAGLEGGADAQDAAPPGSVARWRRLAACTRTLRNLVEAELSHLHPGKGGGRRLWDYTQTETALRELEETLDEELDRATETLLRQGLRTRGPTTRTP